MASILLLAALLLFLKGPRSLPFANDPRFVATTPPTLGPPANASLLERATLSLLSAIQRLQGPRPLNHFFAPCPTNRCSIQGLLNQCMGVTGTRYVIAKDVAAGSFEFGHPVTLNGPQWVSAVFNELRQGRVEWWDPKVQTFNREGLLLLTNDSKTVLVIPKAMAAELQMNQTRAHPRP